MTIESCNGLTGEEITLVREYIKNNGGIMVTEYQHHINIPFNVYIPLDLKVFHLVDKLKIFTYHFKMDGAVKDLLFDKIDKTKETLPDNAGLEFNSMLLALTRGFQLDSFDTNEKFIELVKQNQ